MKNRGFHTAASPACGAGTRPLPLPFRGLWPHPLSGRTPLDAQGNRGQEHPGEPHHPLLGLPPGRACACVNGPATGMSLRVTTDFEPERERSGTRSGERVSEDRPGDGSRERRGRNRRDVPGAGPEHVNRPGDGTTGAGTRSGEELTGSEALTRFLTPALPGSNLESQRPRCTGIRCESGTDPPL